MLKKIAFGMTTIILLLLAVVMTFAQGGATSVNIVGKVLDSQNAAISGATITAKNLSTNLIRETISQSDGSFSIVQLPPGNYEIVANMEGFSSKTYKQSLELGIVALVNFNLEVGQNAEIIEIVASNEFSQEKTENSTNINPKLINDLPINRRNFLDFALTTPRATKDRAPAQGVVASSGISFNGQQARFNNVSIDGLDNNETAAGSVRATLSQDAIQEFQVVSDSYSAEFGRALGGVVNIITKAGGSEFRGSLFFLNRNDSTSARDVFAPTEPEYKQYQFGATFSGPIKKDKIFFFNSFERLSVKQSNFVTISNQTVNSAKSLGFTLDNGPIPFAFGTTSALTRVDFRLGQQDNLFVRYNFGGNYNGAFEPFGGLSGQTAGGIQLLDENTLAVNNTYSSTSLNLINETRFLFGLRNQDVNAPDNSTRVQLIAPEGIVTFGRTIFLSQPRRASIYQIIDNVSLTRGRHQIKFGGDYYYVNLPGDGRTKVPIFSGGFAVFAPLDFSAFGGPTISGIEAFDPKLRTPQQRAFLTNFAQQLALNFPLASLPLPTAFAQGFGNPVVTIDQKQLALFFQDNIKLSENFLLKLGVRYDINRIGFVPKNNGFFSPRIAISYRPKKLENLTIKAGYGIFASTQLFGNATLVELTSATNAIKIPVIPFPFSAIPFSLPNRKFPEGLEIPTGVDFIPQLSSTFVYDRKTRTSYTQQSTFGVDYLAGNNTSISLILDYVRGLRLLSVRNINPVVRPVVGNALQSQLVGRVFPDLGQIFEFSSSYDSYYSSFTISVKQRISDQFNLQAHYTLSKTIDNFLDIGTDIQETNDSLNIAAERALSLQDVRSRFVLSGTFESNLLKNKYLRDFQFSTIVNLETGRPYNLLAGADLNLNADNPPGDRPLGLGRNAGISPGFANIDIRLSRKVRIGEKAEISGIFEVFNLFNRVNISDIARVFPPDKNGNFQLPKKSGNRFIASRDRFLGAFSPRQIQLGFRVSF